MEAIDWRYFLGMTPAFMLAAILAYASECGGVAALEAANATAEMIAAVPGHASVILGVLGILSLCAGGCLFFLKGSLSPVDLTRTRIKE